jgi:hypothetical protein
MIDFHFRRGFPPCMSQVRAEFDLHPALLLCLRVIFFAKTGSLLFGIMR